MAKVWTSAGPKADRRVDGLDAAAADGGTGSPTITSKAIMGPVW